MLKSSGISIDEALEKLSAAQDEIEMQQRVIDGMKKEISDQKTKLDAQAIVILQGRKRLEESFLQIKLLTERLTTQLRYRFCPHSEKSEYQLDLFSYEEYDENCTSEPAVSNGRDIVVKQYIKRACGRRKLPKELERRENVIDIPESEKECACGHRLVKVGEDRSERLQIIPAQVYVEVTVRPKYACRFCEGSEDEEKPVFRQMPAPVHLIPKSIASESLLAYVIVNKYCNHMPYYRQSQDFMRRGIHISRADMDNWEHLAYSRVKPMERVLLEHIKSGSLMNLDETTVRVLKYENHMDNESRQKSYVWVAHGRTGGKTAVLYKYYESRSSKYIKYFINGFRGFLQTDEYPGYEAALNEHSVTHPDDRIIHVACLAHVRRKFWDAAKAGQGYATNAEMGLKYIQEIYLTENRLREQNLDAGKLIAERKSRILPKMQEFHDWMVKIRPTVLPSYKFGKALEYALSAWNHILNYIECPDIYLDNTIVERDIRPYTVSRKNWMFSGSEDGARSTCLMFSLIETAKGNGLNPETYLTKLFKAAPDYSLVPCWKGLLPWNIGNAS